MKSDPSPSAPLVPLVAPVGVTGTTLPASAVKDTPAKPLRLCPSCRVPVGAHITDWCRTCGADLPPASPVASVGVADLGKAASDLLDFLEQYPHEYGTDISGYVDAVQEAIPSHAAKDAKIKALEEAVRGLLNLPILKTVDGMQGAHFASLVAAVAAANAALE